MGLSCAFKKYYYSDCDCVYFPRNYFKYQPIFMLKINVSHFLADQHIYSIVKRMVGHSFPFRDY